VSMEVDGKPIPAETLKDAKLVFAEDKITKKGSGRDDDATYAIDPTTKPPTLDLTPQGGGDKGRTLRGIYQLDGDTLKVCLAHPDAKERPKELASTKDPKTALMVLKREKP